MPRHDNRHAPDGDMAITIVFLIVMVAVLLFLAVSPRTYTLGLSSTHSVSMPVVPPM